MSQSAHAWQKKARDVCEVETGGSYDVALSQSHFEEQLQGHLVLPELQGKDVAPQLVRMGFPRPAEDRWVAAAIGLRWLGPWKQL